MSNIFTFHESDWKLYRKKIPQWQEDYMERLNKEYIAILSAPGLASTKFWALEKRIRQDKKKPGVIVEMSRSNMDLALLGLFADGAITLDDLDGFSSDLREWMVAVTAGSHR